jgi:hypothetical protein
VRCPTVWVIEWSRGGNKKYTLVLDGNQSTAAHTTTNQQQVATMEERMKRRFDKRKVYRK